MAVPNPFGLLNNDPTKIVRADEVLSGLACNCYCPKCRDPFQGVRLSGGRRYFRHHNHANCKGAFESAVHLLAKRVLIETKCLMLPHLEVRPSSHILKSHTIAPQKEIVARGQLVHFDRVEDEVWMDGRIPDIVAWNKEQKFLIEIIVTNPICEEKRRWILKQDVPTIRVHLDWAGYDINAVSLARSLREGRAVNVTPRFGIVYWEHHPSRAEAQARVNSEYLRSIAEIPTQHPADEASPQGRHGRQRTLDFDV